MQSKLSVKHALKGDPKAKTQTGLTMQKMCKYSRSISISFCKRRTVVLPIFPFASFIHAVVQWMFLQQKYMFLQIRAPQDGAILVCPLPVKSKKRVTRDHASATHTGLVHDIWPCLWCLALFMMPGLVHDIWPCLWCLALFMMPSLVHEIWPCL